MRANHRLGFREKSVPDGGKLAGWAALVQALGISARREGEFQKLRDEEMTSMEAIVDDAFAGF